MPSKPATQQQLLAENEDLRARLAEAEEVLHAIGVGDVDAVLVNGVRGEQFYTLSGADRIYRRLIETMTEGALTLSADGVILYCNAHLAQMLGRPLDQVLGSSLRDYLSSADERALDAMLAQDSTAPSRLEINLKAGESRPVPVYLSASRLEMEGAEMVFCLVLTDLTEQKSHERIAADKLRYEAVTSTATDAVVTSDGAGRIVDWNPSAERIFGYAQTEVLGQSLTLLIPQRFQDRHLEGMKRVQSGGEQRVIGKTVEVTGRRKDASEFPLELSLARWTVGAGQFFTAFIRDITERKTAEAKVEQHVEQLKSALMSTVEVATTLGELRDPYTAGHERRVAKISVAIGAELGFNENRLQGLRVAGDLHDIGKITIPAEILSKPGKLSPLEYQLIQGHAQASYDVLKNVKFPWPVAEIALQHHERMNGSGYPQGLKGEEILLEARIMAVADVVEAMSSHRPYREALGIDKALAEIERGRGSAYDPVVADACLKLFREKGYILPA